jgi:hypothetical protein
MKSAIIIYLGMGDTFGICRDLDILLNSCYRKDVKTDYATLFKSGLEKETRCVPQPQVSRRDLLRKCQERHGYCQGTKMPYHGLQNRANREFRRTAQIEKMCKEKRIKEAFSRKIENKTHMKRHPYHPIK